jgi:hypothetical protein
MEHAPVKRNITVEWLDGAALPDVADLPPDILSDLQQEITANLHKWQARKATLNAGLERKYIDKASGIRGEPFGTAHVPDGEFDAKVVIEKRVEWDQKKLITACQELEATGQDATEYVTTEIKVAESRYKAWPASVQKIFEPARTTKSGTPKIELLPAKRAAA